MKTTPALITLLVLFTTLSHQPSTWAQGSSLGSFTYQGRLNDASGPANGLFDFQFSLYPASLGTNNQVDTTITMAFFPVTNGLFTVKLAFPLATASFDGNDRWLEIAVRPAGAPTNYTTLSPRQQVTASPYATRSATANLAYALPGVSVNTNTSSTAFGLGTAANGNTSTAMGYLTTANGASATAMGQGTVAGGDSATAMGAATTASGTYATAMGYLTTAGGFASTALGRSSTANGTQSLAAGTQAKALHHGTFVWADNQAADFLSTGTNQFLLRASGGVGINTNNPNGAALAVNGNETVNGNLSATGIITGNGAGLTGVPLGLANSGNALTSAGRFTTASLITLANRATSVTPFDFNGDGRLDLIVPERQNNSVSVLTNDGHGGFAIASTSAALAPSAVALADLNGDGRMDLVCGNNSYYGISILLNNGTGGFTQTSTPVTGGAPGSVAAVDVNQDGWPDAITANLITNTLSILTNRGDGSFALYASPVVGNNPSSVLALDVNADGKVDLVTANGGSHTVTVLTNTGGGVFTVASSPAIGGSSTKVVAADFNGDGRVDLVTSDLSPDTLTVLTNAGQGVFVPAATLPVGIDPATVAAGDLNGDGRADLVSANVVDDTLSVLTNNGSGGFAASQLLGTLPRPLWVVTADFNGDGVPDLLTTHDLTNRISLFFGTTTFSGSFSGSGTELTDLNASSLSAGTLADSRLSANVALRAGGNTFTGNQIVNSGSVGLGKSPAATLDVNGTARIQGGNNWDVNNNEGDFRVGNDSYRFKIGVANAGGGSGDVWMRAHGGTARLFLKTPGGTFIYSNEGQTLGVSLAANGTAWAVISDRNAKKDFTPVDGREILEKLAALPITQWHYKWEENSVTPHIGPMAQDFKAAFYPGSDDKSITTQEADGVALAAIQGLNQKLNEKEAEIVELKKQNDLLARRLGKLEQLFQQPGNGGN